MKKSPNLGKKNQTINLMKNFPTQTKDKKKKSNNIRKRSK